MCTDSEIKCLAVVRTWDSLTMKFSKEKTIISQDAPRYPSSTVAGPTAEHRLQ